MATYGIFRSNYSKLCKTVIDIGDLLPKCVSNHIITLSSKSNIDKCSSPSEKVEKLLGYIAGPLQEGYTKEFLILLKIMKDHGKPLTIQLANELESLCPSSDDVVDPNGCCKKTKMSAHEIIRKFYSKLCNYLTEIDELLTEFLSEDIITHDDKEKIRARHLTKEKVGILLERLQCLLKTGDTVHFLVFLKIMKKYGSKSTVELANELEELYESSDNHDINETKQLVDGAVVFDQIQNKEERPSMKDLYGYVVHKYASDWNDISIELGLEASIKIIETDHQKCGDRLKETLRKWLDSTPCATWKTLEVAITNVKRTQMSLDRISDVYATEKRDLKSRSQGDALDEQLIASKSLH